MYLIQFISISIAPVSSILSSSINLAFIASFGRQTVILISIHKLAWEAWTWNTVTEWRKKQKTSHQTHKIWLWNKLFLEVTWCNSSPLSGSKETSRTAAQVASVGVGAAIAAGVCACATFVHILAATSVLLKVKAGRTDALEAAQGVVAGSRAANGPTLTFIFICKTKNPFMLLMMWTQHVQYSV